MVLCGTGLEKDLEQDEGWEDQRDSSDSTSFSIPSLEASDSLPPLGVSSLDLEDGSTTGASSGPSGSDPQPATKQQPPGVAGKTGGTTQHTLMQELAGCVSIQALHHPRVQLHLKSEEETPNCTFQLPTKLCSVC